MIDALATEWLKLRTVRTSLTFLLVLALTVLLCLGYTVYVVQLWEGFSTERQSQLLASPPGTLARMILPLAAGVFGVLMATTEYATGTIRPTFTALPRRGTVLLARATLTVCWATAGAAACFLTILLVAEPIVGDRPIDHLTTPVLEMLPYLLMQLVGAGVIALVGLGVGFLVRGTTSGVVTIVVLVFLGQMVVGNLPSPWDERISSVLLVELGNQIVADPTPTQSMTNGMLSAPEAVGVLLAYVVGSLVLATVRLRRDC